MERTDLKGVVPIEHTFGDDAEDTDLLRKMAERANEYLRSFRWCKEIRESYFGDGIGGIVAVFLFRIAPSEPDVDEWLWVVVGDVPPAYLVTDGCKSPSQAIEGYIEEMSRWVDLAKQGRSSPKVIPVPVEATPEHGAALESRLRFLREVIVPRFREAETQRS
jgi:hypothetical protein